MSKCCHLNCTTAADFRIEWGAVANPDNYTYACEAHVGALIGHHPGEPQPDHYRVVPYLNRKMMMRNAANDFEAFQIADALTAIARLEQIAAEHGHGTSVYLEVVQFSGGPKSTRWVAHQRGWKSYCSTFVEAVQSLDERLSDIAASRRGTEQRRGVNQ